VRPAIFGSLFEGTVDAQAQGSRHSFTSEADIMKIVRPTISRYWEERIEVANTIAELSPLQLELQSYRVLDPACGSGNFLYISRTKANVLLDKIAERRKSSAINFKCALLHHNNSTALILILCGGIGTGSTLMIGRKIAIDNLNLYEPALPLDSLDKNVVCQDLIYRMASS